MSNITLEEYLNRLEQFRRRESNNQARLLPGRLPISIIIDDAGPDQSSNHCPVYNPARLLPGRYTTYESNPGSSFSGVLQVQSVYQAISSYERQGSNGNNSRHHPPSQ